MSDTLRYFDIRGAVGDRQDALSALFEVLLDTLNTCFPSIDDEDEKHMQEFVWECISRVSVFLNDTYGGE